MKKLEEKNHPQTLHFDVNSQLTKGKGNQRNEVLSPPLSLNLGGEKRSGRDSTSGRRKTGGQNERFVSLATKKLIRER